VYFLFTSQVKQFSIISIKAMTLTGFS